MAFVRKKINSWAAVEDDLTIQTMEKLYGPFLFLTLIFPKWRGRKNMIKTILLIIYNFLVMVPHFYLLGESIILIRDDFNLVSMALLYWCIYTFVTISINIFNSIRFSLARTHRILSSDVGVYGTGRIYSEAIPRQYEKNKRKELLKFLCLPALVMLLAAGVLIVPYLNKLSDEKYEGESHYSDRGVNFNLPIAARYPFPTHQGIGHAVAVCGQLAAGTILGLFLGAVELMCFRLSQAIIFEFKVLRYGVDIFSARARQIYEKKDPNLVDRQLNKGNYEYQRCIGESLKESIRHHYNIKRYRRIARDAVQWYQSSLEVVPVVLNNNSEKYLAHISFNKTTLLAGYEDIMRWPGILAFGFGTGTIGLSLINVKLAREAGDLQNLILFLLMTLATTLNMYMLSVFGEDITTESKFLRDQLYLIEWHNLDVQNRRLLLNFMSGNNKPVIVKAGGIMSMNMDTFSSIVNTAYSFFNLMNTQ